MDVLLNRRSVRKYDSTKKISRQDLEMLCRYAEAAPSARNQKSRCYIVVDDQAVLNQLATCSNHAKFLAQAVAVIAVIATDADTLPTPHMQVQDLAATTQNLLLKATEQQIGSCWIGIYPVEERMRRCDEILSVPPNMHTFALVALGYPQDENCFFDAEKWSDTLLHHNRY